MLTFEYKKSGVSGYGLFATTDIKKDESICNYFGKMIPYNSNFNVKFPSGGSQL